MKVVVSKESIETVFGITVPLTAWEVMLEVWETVVPVYEEVVEFVDVFEEALVDASLSRVPSPTPSPIPRAIASMSSTIRTRASGRRYHFLRGRVEGDRGVAESASWAGYFSPPTPAPTPASPISLDVRPIPDPVVPFPVSIPSALLPIIGAVPPATPPPSTGFP